MDDFRSVMTEWLSLKHQLAEARKDMSVLNKREKELRQVVQTHMKREEVDVIKVQQDKVSLTTKERKGSITKDIIIAGLRTYFGGDEARVEGAFQAIMDSAPVKQALSLSVRKMK